MIILGIETSCDETALSIIEVKESADNKKEIKILSNQVLSQIELHKQYGGVFPMMAKREHAKNLIPLLKKTLEESCFLESRIKNQESRMGKRNYSHILQNVRIILEREPELLEQFLEFIPNIEKFSTRPVRSREGSQRDSASNGIDLIAVTAGPGLEPALWVGINFAKALSVAWDVPVVPTNHMEGHVLVALLQEVKSEKLKVKSKKGDTDYSGSYYTLNPIPCPALALLISGGHTEMVLMKKTGEYEIVGRTRDDAVGEAFDKVARILGLPYPGGPEISRLAEETRKFPSYESRIMNYELKLPRPMLHSDNLDFSFSGLKTAVLYLVKKLSTPLDEHIKMEIAREFEDSVTEIIIKKVKKAIEAYGVQTLILGGGVVANKNIRRAFETLSKELGVTLKLPAIDHATDNALMIALAGYFNRIKALTENTGLLEMKAEGGLHF